MIGRIHPLVRSPAPDLAAVSVSSGHTVEGRIVEVSPDGRVTLQTRHGCFTARPVAPEWRRASGLMGLLSRR